ncbi:OpgC domain-containing protein [Cereibacter sphaeroides]|uniref:OpgC family protein n=1 Tax=Cereibacter sphaeroides TaxID=1063 RepID=UPI001F2647F8|nr:OpgC domain-containing protein [Cereibacter sphaeroides]MCE6959581.1 OpgC domain-containing protein [Cereibacter sphaeroides]MCE6974559.1 OpgC domain-containing protein [Cereibacter sphaeroides]
MPRSGLLDGMRGYFLVFMLLNHLVFQGSFWLVQINHRQLAFVEDAQGFIFLSGLLVGLVQGRRYLKAGVAAMRSSLLHRILELWVYTTGLISLGWLLRDTLPGGMAAWKNWLGSAGFADLPRLAGMLTLVFQPTFLDILPQYIVYLSAGLLVIPLILKGRWPLVMTVSGLLWLAAQLGLNRVLSAPIHGMFLASDGQGLRVAFDVFGWQIVFVTGMVLGGLTVQKKIDWSQVFRPDRLVLPALALLVVAVFAPLRVTTAWGWMPGEVLRTFSPFDTRSNFSLVYLVNFTALALLVTWLILAGPACEKRWIRRLAIGLRWLFSLAPLRLLGRHSLQVYAWHVVLVYGVRYADSVWHFATQVEKTAVAAVALALLYLPALWRERGAAASQAGVAR